MAHKDPTDMKVSSFEKRTGLPVSVLKNTKNPIRVDDKTPIRDIVDELTYRSYAYNRQYRPDIKPEDWAWVFVDAKRFEERYQKEADKAAQNVSE